MRNARHVSWFAVSLLMSAFPAAGAVRQTGQAADALTLTSPACAQGEEIPPRYTNDGEDISPPLVIAGAPQGTAAFALIMDDPDAPGSTWVHWVVWSIPAGTREIASGTHRDFFKLFALDVVPDLPTRAGAAALRRAIEGHVLATAELMGMYRRR
jgi:phosphatidylethanolamine-binding protein (PEBP) family uncharacterized protein